MEAVASHIDGHKVPRFPDQLRQGQHTRENHDENSHHDINESELRPGKDKASVDRLRGPVQMGVRVVGVRQSGEDSRAQEESSGHSGGRLQGGDGPIDVEEGSASRGEGQVGEG